MRLRFFFFLCWLLPIGARAQSPTFVQKFEGEHTASGATTVVGSPSVGNAGANHLLFCAGTVLIAATNVGFTDNVGLSWNAITLPNIVQTPGSPFLPNPSAMTDGNGTNQTYLAWASTGASTTVSSITMSWTTSVNTSSIHCAEYSSANLVSPIDVVCDFNGPFVRSGGAAFPPGGYFCDLAPLFTNEIVIGIGQYQDSGTFLTLNGYTNMVYTGHNGGSATFSSNPLTFTTRAGGASSANGIIMGDASVTGATKVVATDFQNFVYGIVMGVMIKGSGSTGFSSIMKGCTVSPTNVPNCTLPAGWSLNIAQGFDTGSIGGNEVLNLFAIENSFTHTGSRAASYLVDRGGGVPEWTVTAAAVNARETYASWWEWADSTSALNTNWFIGTRINSLGHGDVYFDRDPPPMCAYNCAPSGGNIQSFDEGSGGVPNFAVTGPALNLKFGQWNQWEMHHRLNDPNVANGKIELFLNGVLVFQEVNTNFTGARDGIEWNVAIGAAFEDRINYDDAPLTLCAPPNEFAAPFGGPNYTMWTATTNPCPLQSPPNGHGPTFNWYIDDIIVLTCATPGACSTIAGSGSTNRHLP